MTELITGRDQLAGYERITVTVSVTVDHPVGPTYRSFVDAAQRRRWLPAAALSERSTITPRSARFDWDDGTTRLHITFLAKSADRSTITVQHLRRHGAEQAAEIRDRWREHLHQFSSLVAQ